MARTSTQPVQLELTLDLGLGLDFDPEPTPVDNYPGEATADPYVLTLREAAAANAQLEAIPTAIADRELAASDRRVARDQARELRIGHY